MIDKATQEWNRLQAGESVPHEGPEASKVLKQIATVRDVLRKMCDVNVTRATVRDAVLEALRPVLQEHKDELFPEIGEMRALWEERTEEIDGRFRQVYERIDAVDAELRKEIQEMTQGLTQKLSDIHDLVARVGDAVNERLQRVEKRLEDLSKEELNELQGSLKSVVEGVGQTSSGIELLQTGVNSELNDLRGLLSTGIDRWEDNQTQMRERLTAIRDSLRDQFQAAQRQVEAGQGGIMKVFGKESGLKLSRQEWDEMAAKLEGIISGIDAILLQQKDG